MTTTDATSGGYQFFARVDEVGPGRIVLELDGGHELESLVRSGDEVVLMSELAFRDVSQEEYL